LGRAGAPFFAAAQRPGEREGGKGAPFFAAPGPASGRGVVRAWPLGKISGTPALVDVGF
jgi:hypothetical protein